MNSQFDLILNINDLNELPNQKRSVYVYEYLIYLERTLPALEPVSFKENQKQIIDKLWYVMHEYPFTPIRKRMARCFALLLNYGDPGLVFDLIDRLNDILKNKDDSQILSASECLGVLYEHKGRLLGKTYEASVSNLLKCLKNSESKVRIQILNTLNNICRGMGNSIAAVTKEIYKVCKNCLIDRVKAVRCAAAKCLLEMLDFYPYMYTIDIENVITLCFRAFETADYEVRYIVANLVAALMAASQKSSLKHVSQKDTKMMSKSLSPSATISSPMTLSSMSMSTSPSSTSPSSTCPSTTSSCLSLASTVSLPTASSLPSSLSLSTSAAVTPPSVSSLHMPTVSNGNATLSPSSSLSLTAAANIANGTTSSTLSLEDCLALLASGFVRGSTANFYKGTVDIIKGHNQTVSREIRVGVTYAYVVFANLMGGHWLERNLRVVLSHILFLLANPKLNANQTDAIYARKCVDFILRNVFGRILNEKPQFLVCKKLIWILMKEVENLESDKEHRQLASPSTAATKIATATATATATSTSTATVTTTATATTTATNGSIVTAGNQQLLISALTELGHLSISLGTCVQNLLGDPTLEFLPTLFRCLSHPCLATRLHAATCLRKVCVAAPNQIIPVLDTCVERFERKISNDAISGWCATLAAVLGLARPSSASSFTSNIAIPYLRVKEIFNVAESLLRSASRNAPDALTRVSNGWLVIGAIMTLGDAAVTNLLPRVLLLWRNSFPKSFHDLDSEKARGDLFTWKVTLESRAGALAAMHSFCTNCPELVSDDVARKLIELVEHAFRMLINLKSVFKNYGNQLREAAAAVRLKLYEIFHILIAKGFDFEQFNLNLTKMLVNEFTLVECQQWNAAGYATTSLTNSICESDVNLILLGSQLLESDCKLIEMQLEKMDVIASASLENDIHCLYRKSKNVSISNDVEITNPCQVEIATIDMAILLFGKVFGKISAANRTEIVDGLADVLKNAKNLRKEAIEFNVFVALQIFFKEVLVSKSEIDFDSIKSNLPTLIMQNLVCNRPLLRIVVAQNCGRFAKAVGNATNWTCDLIEIAYEKLKLARDVQTRTAFSLALGFLHRFVGGLETSHHLHTSVSILTALAQDLTSSTVQVYALHSLILISESSGPLFRTFVEPLLNLSVRLLFLVPESSVDVYMCVGALLASLVQTIGPDFQSQSKQIDALRLQFLTACTILYDHENFAIKAEAVNCLQQLHLFVPLLVDLSSLVPTLHQNLFSNHLYLRKAALSCLKQLCQKEAKEVCDYVLQFLRLNAAATNESDCDSEYGNGRCGGGGGGGGGAGASESGGLPGALFTMLNIERDFSLIKDIHDTLSSMLIVLAPDNISLWLKICKNVLSVTGTENSKKFDVSMTDEKMTTTAAVAATSSSPSAVDANAALADLDEDICEFYSAIDETTLPYAILPKWPTKVFATECVRKIIRIAQICDVGGNCAATVSSLNCSQSNRNFLVLHLSELIRMAFMAATSSIDQLRLEGLKLLYEIIAKFAKIRDSEFDNDYYLLEEYQAQIGAALRPAFMPDTLSYLVDTACEVCSIWITSFPHKLSSDLRRIYELLVQSLYKLDGKSLPPPAPAFNNEPVPHKVFNENSLTLERLAILKAWANIYAFAINDTNSESAPTNDLLALVQPHLSYLMRLWLESIREFALISLPNDVGNKMCRDSGVFYKRYTIDTLKVHFLNSWHSIIGAIVYAMKLHDRRERGHEQIETAEWTESKFNLIFGICVENLCNPRSSESVDNVMVCLRVLRILIDGDKSVRYLWSHPKLIIELNQIFYRLILTRDNFIAHKLCFDICTQILEKVPEKVLIDEIASGECDNNNGSGNGNGNGNGNGIFAADSLIFSLIEFHLCLVLKYFPKTRPQQQQPRRPQSSLPLLFMQNNEFQQCLSICLQNFSLLHNLCSYDGALKVVPMILFICIEIVCENAKVAAAVPAALSPSLSLSLSLSLSNHESKFHISSDKIANHAVLNTLRTLCVSKHNVHKKWQELLQSTLSKVIEMAKTSDWNNADNQNGDCCGSGGGDCGSDCDADNNIKYDKVTIMQTLAVFMTNCEQNVLAAPNLQYPCLNYFQSCLQNSDVSLREKTIEILRDIFADANETTARHYIRLLAPSIVELLYRNAIDFDRLDTAVSHSIICKSIAVLEVLIERATAENRIHMISLLTPVLLKFVLADDSQLAIVNFRTIHDNCFKCLIRIAPKYLQEFKSFVNNSPPQLKNKLETALKKPAQRSAHNRIETITSKSTKQNNPTIKLKTDFNDFC